MDVQGRRAQEGINVMDECAMFSGYMSLVQIFFLSVHGGFRRSKEFSHSEL